MAIETTSRGTRTGTPRHSTAVLLTVGAWLAGGALLLAAVADVEARQGIALELRAADEAAVERPVGPPAPPAAPEVHPDRQLILSVIRDHRRTAEESWRQHLADAIWREARQAAVDPLLVASIVALESSFSSQVVSSAGAVGLMQLRPFVAQDVAERCELEWRGIETLHRPDLNVRLGILYFKELVERFEGDARVALTAYNYGPTRVSTQIRQGTYRGSRYAERILGLYESLASQRSDAGTET